MSVIMQGSAGWYRRKPKPVAITAAQFYVQKTSHKTPCLVKQSPLLVRSSVSENKCTTAENSISPSSVNSGRDCLQWHCPTPSRQENRDFCPVVARFWLQSKPQNQKRLSKSHLDFPCNLKTMCFIL